MNKMVLAAMEPSHPTPDDGLAPKPSPDVEGFLSKVTALSLEFGLGITGEPVLFLMEGGPCGDSERVYSMSADSTLLFE